MAHFLVTLIPDTNLELNLEEPQSLNFNYATILQSVGGGGSENVRLYQFQDSGLAIDGSIMFPHNLGSPYVDFSVYSPDFGEVNPDDDLYEPNQLTIWLQSYRPLVGIWRIRIEGGL